MPIAHTTRHQVLIVDGYNVIRNNKRYAGLGTDYDGSSAWNNAREAVINDAALLAGKDYEKCTVVFDGAGNVLSKGTPKKQAGIDVIFSPAGVSADSVIEKLAHDARERGFEVVVVSSDFTIQSTVFGGGVTRMSAAGFASAGDELEETWKDEKDKPVVKNTLGERLDPSTRAKLEAMLNGNK
jgi:uncharacterized protein